jgi:hypothetical protein
MTRAEQLERRKIRVQRLAGKRVRWCAMYVATKGFTVPPDGVHLARVFAELKTRLRLGSFRNVTHMRSHVLSMYGVSLERAG